MGAMKTIGQGFTLALPSRWVDRTLTTLVAPVGRTGFAANIVITHELVSAGQTAAAYARAQLSVVKAQLPFLEVVDERAVQLQALPAFQRLQRFYAEGHQVQQAQTFIVSGARAYVITYSATVEEFDAGLPALREVTDTFKLFDPEGGAL
jgi:hypothetical protein